MENISLKHNSYSKHEHNNSKAQCTLKHGRKTAYLIKHIHFDYNIQISNYTGSHIPQKKGTFNPQGGRRPS